MLRISPGNEDEFRYFQEWLAASAALEKVVEASEQDHHGCAAGLNGTTDRAMSRVIASLRLTTVERAGRCAPPAGQGRHNMWFHLYVAEKMRELDEARFARIPHAGLRELESRRRSKLGRVAATTGRAMQRAGEAIEVWATPVSEREGLRITLARARKSE